MNGYALLADAVLLLHFAFVVFVVFGLLLIILGGLRQWPSVRNRWFRILHLAAIVVVAAQAWLGRLCPLTLLEMWLRRLGGQAAYEGSFIRHWIEEALYYSAPAWVFALAYTLFLALVVAAWIIVPPASSPRRCHHARSTPE